MKSDKTTIFEALSDKRGLSVDGIGCVYSHYHREMTESAIRSLDKADSDNVKDGIKRRVALFAQPYPMKISFTVGDLLSAKRTKDESKTEFKVPCTLPNGMSKTVTVQVNTL